MNNFSHGPVDVTSGIFYRPKDSKKTLLKSIFKNMLRQLGVAYTDSCCGDEYDPNPIVTVTAPIHTISGSGGVVTNNTVTTTLLHQSKTTLNYYTFISHNDVASLGRRVILFGSIPGYVITNVSHSWYAGPNNSYNVWSEADATRVLSSNNETAVPTLPLHVKIFLTYTKL